MYGTLFLNLDRCSSRHVSQTSLQRVRDVYEQAIMQLGLDIARGPIIWEAYRDFEERLLDVMLSLGDAKHAYVSLHDAVHCCVHAV